MELESRSIGSQLGVVQTRKPASRSPAAARARAQAWLQAWRRAKTMVTEAEADARRFAQPWAEVWTRAETKARAKIVARTKERADEAAIWADVRRAQRVQREQREQRAQEARQARALVGRASRVDLWRQIEEDEEAEMWSSSSGTDTDTDADTDADAEIETRADAEALGGVEIEALALAGAWGWAQSRARTQGEKVPSALADLGNIRLILSSLNHSGVAQLLWYRSLHGKDEYSCIIHFIAPITRLPLELLRHIFLIIIDEASSPPLGLMLVCKHWHAIVTNIWASFNLGTRTPIDDVRSKLEGSQWLLDVVVDTDSDRGDFTLSDGAFEAIFAAIEFSSRWRSLVVKSFPGQTDVREDIVNRRLQRCSNCSNSTMTRFTTFKVMSACETSPLLHGLLGILGKTASSELTRVEVNSPNVISFLAPAYPSMFHSVKVLSLDTAGTHDPVDLLPHLHRLESFTASHISFPIYSNDVELPFIHTLRHLRLRVASIQWMSHRTFHVLEDCTLIFPLHRHVLHTFSANLPNCMHLTFQGSPLNILRNISAHTLNCLSVTHSGPFNRWGDEQLVQLSQRQPGPKNLHIGIEATNQAWVAALALMPGLEELVIHSARPSSIGAKVFQSLVVQQVDLVYPRTASSPEQLGVPLCPFLKRFGLKYDRWLRSSKQFNLIPVFMSIIRSRQHLHHSKGGFSLESFTLHMKRDQKNPLKLIRRYGVSVIGFMNLADASEVEEASLKFTFAELRQASPAARCRPSFSVLSLLTGRNSGRQVEDKSIWTDGKKSSVNIWGLAPWSYDCDSDCDSDSENMGLLMRRVTMGVE